MNRNIITRADATRSAALAAVAIREQQKRAIAATLAVVTELFREFRPTIDGAISALEDLHSSLIVHGFDETVPGSTWSRIMSKIEELTEENPEREGK